MACQEQELMMTTKRLLCDEADINSHNNIVVVVAVVVTASVSVTFSGRIVRLGPREKEASRQVCHETYRQHTTKSVRRTH